MNGPRIVCAGCGAETALFKPICDSCSKVAGWAAEPGADLIAAENRRRVDKDQAPLPLIFEVPEALAQAMAPHFDWCVREAKRGAPGMFLAQAWRNDDGRCFMRCGFIPNRAAERLRQMIRPPAPPADVLTVPHNEEGKAS